MADQEKTFYPSGINPAYSSRQNRRANATGCRAVHQAMKGANNICNNSANIAYWGDRFPDKTHSRNPLRYYPNTITAFSGTWNLPSPFTTAGWNIPSSVPDSAIVKRIDVEYAITHVQYMNEHVVNAGWAYYSDGCKFYASELSSGAGNVRAESGGVAKNCQTDYKIILKGFGNNKEVSGQGLKYNQRIRSNKDKYSSMSSYSSNLYNGSNKKLTIGKLKSSTLHFILPRNLNWDIGRIVMKYLRIKVKYTPKPKYEIDSITASPSTITTCPNKTSKVTVKIKSTDGYTGNIDVAISGNGTVSNAAPGTGNTFNGTTWHITKFDSNKTATLTYNVAYNTIGKKTITAKVQNSKKSTSIQVEACEPTFKFEFLQDNKYKDSDNNTQHQPGDYYSTSTTKFEFFDYDDKSGFFKIIFHRTDINDDNEYIEIDSGGLEILSWGKVSGDTNINIQKVDDYLWRINNINHEHDIILHGFANFDMSGVYAVIGRYINKTQPKFNKSKKYEIIIKGGKLGKEYFKLRLEDGSDVRYNSLMFTKGDDLKIPLTYTTEDINMHIDNIIIKGNTKRIPIDEIQYMTFTIDLNTEEDIEIKNILSYIEVVGKDGFRCDDIIIGASDNVKLLNNDNEIICVIDSLKSNETKTIKFAVQSSINQECYIYLKPYNIKEPYNFLEDNPKRWIPAHALFKDIPNIKIWIEGISDLDTVVDGDKFSLYYHIQNLSDTEGKNIRFQIKEPHNFNKIGYSLYEHTPTNENRIENGNNPTSPWFNENNRILTFPILEAHQDNRKDYRLRIDYQATQKGIYDFIIKTLDSPSTLEDDQYENFYLHKLLVNIYSDVRIRTSISKKMPYVNELIDYNINVKNRFKDQKQLNFEIYDIGKYETNHTDNHYEVQPYIDCKYGTFTPSNNGNHIGTWIITNAKANEEYNLTITLNPTQSGTHVIKTTFFDIYNNTKDFENQVKVLEKKKQISFNVYQAVNDDDIKCSNCNLLEQICDDDFINLNDNIYYVFEVQNNNRNPIENINIYARLPESFLTNGILCSSTIYKKDNNNNLINFTIPELSGCNNKTDSKAKFCIKIKPSEIGTFISNFMLSTKNANIINKQLKLTVDTVFNERKLEHEINIYNFEKTNKYYRYEIDNVGEIFKFFNKGDKSVRLIDNEQHKESSVETYKGTNLRRLVKEIKEKSKYVDPLFLREGSNKLQDKGYELYPDGLIRRFGLLESEIYHYSHQFPETSNLVQRAMKWDIDTWDTKLWAGDIYDNGVFDLTIDYSKIPSNFDILNSDNINPPIKNLQNIVDNAKPYGTKAICYYSATANLKLSIFIDRINTVVNKNLKLSFNIPQEKIGIIAEENRHDKSLNIHYDLFKIKLSTIIKDILLDIGGEISDNSTTLSPNIKKVNTTIYTATTKKNYIQDCEDIVNNIYSTKEKNNNIDITKEYNSNDFESTTNTTLSNQKIINFVNNLENNQSIGLKIKEDKTSITYTYNPHYSDGILEVPDTNNIYFVFNRDDVNYFNGFKIIVNEEVIESYNIFEDIKTVSMQVQVCNYEGYKILHFWGSINKQEYYHIGHLLTTGIERPIVELLDDNVEMYQCNIDKPITFKLSDRINILNKSFDYIDSMERNHKWNKIKNIGKDNKYASFKNDIDIDKECDKKNNNIVNIPKLILKYNNINLDDTDEIVDIGVKIKAQSNKKDFIKNVNINMYKDGDTYIPENNIAKKICYPSSITNVTQEFLATMLLEQPNFTICGNCLRTNLGYYEECPDCHSTNVYHSNEKIPATVCYNCGYIAKGWHDYCTHCLSYDIEKVKIDYNKTFCNNCGTTTDDYYNHCPSCFSPNVIHLTNNKKTYKIFDKTTQNIDPININIDKKKINIFNLEIPFSEKTKEINKKTLQYFDLHVHGTNHNDGKYYYCESCGFGDIGNYDVCPKCNSKLVHNYQIDNYAINTYYQDIKELPIGSEKISGKFDTKIDIQSLALKNKYESFNLLFYIENQSYDEITNQVLKLPINTEYIGNIIQKLSRMDISIDNLSLDYKYINEKEWVGLNKLYDDNHTGIIYNIPYNKKTTDSIKFNKFDIDTGKYKHAYLYLNGLTKGVQNFNIEMMIENNGHKYYYTSPIIDGDMFNYQFDITEITGNNLKDVNAQIYFNNVQSDGQIIILDCNIITEKEQYKNIIHDNINNINTKIKDEKQQYYLLTSSNNDIWGLKNIKPYYISGKHFDTNLIMYIDFGTLNLQEYLRVYDIELVILYKNKIGHIVTGNIPVNIENNLNTLPQGASLPKDGSHPEQQFNGTIQKVNGESWLSLKYPSETENLNNLEYEVTNINDSDELLNAIPLYKKLAQSFIAESSEISQLTLAYYKNRGYPSDIVNVYLCKDDNNKPGKIIRGNKIKIDIGVQSINIDLDAYDLTIGDKYWFVIEDNSANEYNYHQFKYNNNTDKGQLIRYENDQAIYDINSVLSFNIDNNTNIKNIYDLPTFWSIDYDENETEYDAYKMYINFYRYNIQPNSNISISNLHISSGYNIIEDEANENTNEY